MYTVAFTILHTRYGANTERTQTEASLVTFTFVPVVLDNGAAVQQCVGYGHEYCGLAEAGRGYALASGS